MRKFFKEFKDFATRGNVIDLAVGVIIGAAFQAIINSLVKDVISPALGAFVQTDFSDLAYVLVPEVTTIVDGVETVTQEAVLLKYGSFITAVINFILMAFIIFLLVKLINKITSIGKKKEDPAPAAPTTKKCPFCCTEIDIHAVKCPHCTSDQPAEE